MKKTIILLLLFGTFSLQLIGQNNSGMIVYEQKINMHRRMADESMKAMIPEFRTSKNQLLFNQSSSVFKSYESTEEDESVTEENNGGVMIMIKTPDNVVYKNYDKKISVELRELAGKSFLIQDSIKTITWKVNPASTRMINGYECMEAKGSQKSKMIKMNVSNDNGNKKESRDAPAVKEDQVIAWFAPGISVSSGPSMFGGLPGLILEVDINDGEATFIAQKIELKSVSDKEVKEPTGGKKVSPAEFNKIQDEFFAEMNKGGGGMRVIRN